MRFALAAAAFCLTVGAAPGQAGQTTVIGMMAGTADELPVVLRIASGLDHHEGLRVLPIAGQGPLQALNDLVHLKGIDAALLQSDVLSYAQRTGLLDVSPKKLSYIVKLGHLDVHVLTRKDIASLADLAGGRIAVGPTSSASYVSAHNILETSGLAFEELPMAGEEAVKAVTEGAADAAILVGEEPLPELERVKGHDLHLIPVSVPDSLSGDYAPALFESKDYPTLVKEGETVETVSAALIIAVFEWPNGSPQSATTATLTRNLFAILQPQEADGAGINLSASVPGWERSLVARKLLEDRAKNMQAAFTEN